MKQPGLVIMVVAEKLNGVVTGVVGVTLTGVGTEADWVQRQVLQTVGIVPVLAEISSSWIAPVLAVTPECNH